MTPEEAAGGLLAAILPADATAAGSCAVCCGAPRDGFSTCWNCHQLRERFGALSPVWILSLTTKDHQLYDNLKRYKGALPNQQRAALQLAGLLAVFLERHAACIGPLDLATWVPSTSGRHPGRHPLAGILDMVEHWLPERADLLRRGLGALDRRQAEPDAFTCDRDLAGARVLLADDTYVTGSHVHAASHALLVAGAAHVVPVAFGRMIDPNYSDESAALLEHARKARATWTPDLCCRCTRHPPTSELTLF